MLDYDIDIDPDIIQKLYPLLTAIKQYHNHEVIGLENIPQSGRVILACNHSLATYDMALLFLEVYNKLGRIPRPLADHLFFKIPFLGEFIEEIGVVDGKQENAKKLLQNGQIVGVAPGGMREALRPSTERYQILWKKRLGFVRLALETETPIVMAVCPKADDLYDVYHNPLTAWAYKKFKVPLFLASGIGFSPIPRKIKLVHFLSEALRPPKPKEDPVAFKRQLSRFHNKVVKKAQELIGEAITYRERSERLSLSKK